MLPIRDINPTRTTPFVNYTIIIANLAAFIWMKSLPVWYEPGYGLVPTRVALDPFGEAFTVFTSMFMHANIAHLVGNLWFLWIFGDNVEDALGHGRYLAFYLIGGIVAGVVQVTTNLAAPIPMIGASGAIAAVTGAYMLLYPRAPILILNPLPLLWLIMGFTLVVPAWFVAGEFFVLNVFDGLRTLHLQSTGAAVQGGVAVFAHVGGFVAGMVLVHPMSRGRSHDRKRQPRSWEGWRPPPGGRYRY